VTYPRKFGSDSDFDSIPIDDILCKEVQIGAIVVPGLTAYMAHEPFHIGQSLPNRLKANTGDTY
jgi:hypothetical protein